MRPDTAAAVAEVVREAFENGRTVTPWGAGTGQGYGYPPSGGGVPDVLLDMTGLNRILAHEPGDLTVTVEAGATLADVQATLARAGQFLPLDPPHQSAGATVGGVLATNACGPLRQGYGRARDWLIGITVADGEGRLIRGGGKVVKNVTGYDLPKLHIGALGGLGVLVEATFKVAPRPARAQTLLFDVSGDGDLAAFLPVLHFETAPVLSLWTEARGHAYLAVGYAGEEKAVEADLTKATEAATRHGLPAPARLPVADDILALNPFSDAAEDAVLLFQAQTRPEHAARQHAALVALGETVLPTGALRVDTWPGVGQSEVSVAARSLGVNDGGASDFDLAALARFAHTVRAWSDQTQTPLALLHAPLELRTVPGSASDADADTLIWRPLPASLSLQSRLKAALDPRGVLNPGRGIGRI